jgi:hypothetical protein
MTDLILSIRQPWAWLILHAGKDIENRKWSTRVRGRILIHAAKGMTRQEYEDGEMMARDASIRRPFVDGFEIPKAEALERGGIVGSVEIVDCVQQCESPWFVGRYGFVLRNPEPLPFRPMRGALGFFREQVTP